jgi:hypothetical protein
MSNAEEMKKEFDESLIDQFKTEVSDRADDVDPSSDHDWFSLTLGWAIAKGLEPEPAHTFAIYIRYHTDLG